MKNIDMALRRLAEEEAPLRLSLVDAAVLKRVEGYSIGSRDASAPFRAVAVAAALAMGIAAGLIPGQTSDARYTFAEISGAAKLAPSTLLIDAS